jgi:hypothetical protein
LPVLRPIVVSSNVRFLAIAASVGCELGIVPPQAGKAHVALIATIANQLTVPESFIGRHCSRFGVEHKRRRAIHRRG